MSKIWSPAQMAVFAKVVELHGFGAAAVALQSPKAAVSRAVAELEKTLGARLLNRTTRRIELTQAGQILYPHCRSIAAAAAHVESLSASWRAERSGTLRLRAEPSLGRALLAPLVPRFLESFPHIPLDVDLREVEFAPGEDADFDVAIRVGREAPAEFTLRELGAPPVVLCATPAYLQKRGEPGKPEDLLQHDLLVPTAAAEGVEMAFSHKLRRYEIKLVPKLVVNELAVLHSATVAGLGIGLLPEFLCRQGLVTQKLRRVLADWELPPPLPLCAVFRETVARDPRIVSLVGFLSAHIVPALASR